jgi:translation initiation factor 1
MAKKKLGLGDLGGLVFSTDPELMPANDAENIDTPAPSGQYLSVRTDKKMRKGKIVTLVEGFEGDEEELKKLAKALKTFCGTGGSAKDGQIIIQGDFRDKIRSKLLVDGYHMDK